MFPVEFIIQIYIPMGFKQRLRNLLLMPKVWLISLQWHEYKKKKRWGADGEADIAFFIKYWNRDLVNAVFFLGAYGRWFVCIWQIWTSFMFFNVCVYTSTYFKEKCHPALNVLAVQANGPQLLLQTSRSRPYQAM